MASGSFTYQLPSTSSHFLRLDWSSTINVANNTSTITASLYYVLTNSAASVNIGSRANSYVSFDGSQETFTANAINFSGVSERLLGTIQRVVSHNSDGTKSINLVGFYPIAATISGQYYASVSVSGTAVLDTIPRISYVSVHGLVNLGQDMGVAVTINTNRQDSSFTHTLRYSFGGLSNQLMATGVGESYSWEPPLSLANQIPNNNSGTISIHCLTYSGSTYIGQSTVTYELRVPTSVVPVINSATISEAVAGLNAKFGAYIQHKSRFRVQTSASGAYSSTISQIRVTLQGNHVYGTDTTTAIVTATGTVPIAVRVIDSRGREANASYNRTVLAYSNPTISTFTASRNEATETIVNFAMNFNIVTLGNANDKEYILDYRQTAPSVSGWTTLTSSTSYYTRDFTHDSSSVFNVDNSYEVRFRVTDYFTTTTLIRTINPTFSLINHNPSGKGIAFGGLSTGDNAEFYLPANFLDLLQVDGEDVWHDGIVESGSNSNGGYLKLPDGTLICWKNDIAGSGTVNVTTAVGNLWRSGTIQWTYPHSFSSEPSVKGHTRYVSGSFRGVSFTENTIRTTNADLMVLCSESVSAITYRFGAIAIGRW